VTANHVVRRLIQRAGAADETASDPGAGRRAGQRRRAPGLALGKQLDAVLAAADDELLTYIRASTDPEAGLAALMADNGKPDPGAARPMSGYRPNSRVGLSRVRRRQGCVSAESRRYTRWVAVSVAAVSAAAGSWLIIPSGVYSLPLAASSLLVVAALAAAWFTVLRWMNTEVAHPWLRRVAARPWRDGRDVLNLALRRLPEVFMSMRDNVLLAPAAVELLMNPADLSLLTELIDIEAVNSSATECYEAEVAAYAAELIGDGPVRVGLTGDSRIPIGRYRLRRDQRQMGTSPVSQPRPHTSDEPARNDLAQVAHAERGSFACESRIPSTMEQPGGGPPLLRLVTNGYFTETQISGARAGRGWNAELQLPEDVTVSREHAKFTFARGHWWVTSLGRNGVMLNGTPLSGVRLVRPGDSILWGRHDGALMSRIEIGAGQGLRVGESW
jgi:hypothetical protein